MSLPRNPINTSVINPLAALIEASLQDEDKYFELWHVDNGAANHPIWNYLVDRAMHDPQAFGESDIDGGFSALMLTVKNLFRCLGENAGEIRLGEDVIRLLERILSNIDHQNFKNLQPCEKQMIEAIKNDIAGKVSENNILEKIKNADPTYFPQEMTNQTKYFALYALLFLGGARNSCKDSTNRALLERIIKEYQSKILANEKRVFNRDRFIWVKNPVVDAKDKYVASQSSNLIFLMQNVYMYNATVKMPENVVVEENLKRNAQNQKAQNQNERPQYVVDKQHEMIDYLTAYGFRPEDFKNVDVVVKKFLVQPDDVTKLELLYFQNPLEKFPESSEVMPVVKKEKISVFEKIKNSVSGFYEKYPRGSRILIAAIAILALSALVIGITIATGGAGAIVGVAALALTAMQLPGAAAAITAIAAGGAVLAGLIDAALVAGIGAIIFSATATLIGIFGGKKEEPINALTHAPSDSSQPSEASRSFTENTSTKTEAKADMPQHPTLKRSSSLRDMSLPAEKPKALVRSASAQDLTAYKRETIFASYNDKGKIAGKSGNTRNHAESNDSDGKNPDNHSKKTF